MIAAFQTYMPPLSKSSGFYAQGEGLQIREEAFKPERNCRKPPLLTKCAQFLTKYQGGIAQANADAGFGDTPLFLC